MAVDKYLYLNAGVPTTKSAATTATANAIVGLDATGKINANMMPNGVGVEAKSVVASGNIAQWDIVNVFLDVATLKARKADPGTNKYHACAYAPAAILDTETGNVYTSGWVTGTFVPGTIYYLDDDPIGTVSATAPSVAGGIVQQVGVGVSETELEFRPQQHYTLES